MAHSLQNYELIFHSNPNAFNFDKQSFKLFPKIVIEDNINSFFSVGEIYFKDQLGVISEIVYFMEGMDVDFKLGNDDDGYIENTFAWANNQLTDTVLSNNLSGNNIFILVDNKYFQSEGKSRSWEDTILNVVNNILSDDYNLDSSKKFLGSTTGIDFYYQGGNTGNSKFIQNLADQAYNQSNPKSPFYTFFNSNGEFYFMTINELFSQKPINAGSPYKIKMSKESTIDPYFIQDYVVQYLGAEENFYNYKIKVFKDKRDLTNDNEIMDYKDFVYRDNDGKILIRKNYQKITRNFNLGLYDDNKDKYRFQGLINSLYKNSALPIRMTIVTAFNPLMVAGKTIELEVESSDLEKGLSKEFSGKWLIMGTKHYADEDSIPYTELLIAKSTIHVDEDHPYKGDFL